MKTKLAALFAIAILAFCPLAEAGLRIGLVVNGGGYCAPRPICSPRPCAFPAVTYASYYSPWYWWGPSTVSYSTGGNGFSNVSSSFATSTGIVRVPPPVVLPTEPITVHPGAGFSGNR